MKRGQSLLWFFIAFLIFPTVSHAQLWSGILAPSRAADWTGAGVVGGIPSGSWTQCGSTIAAYSGTAGTINSAIAACGTNQFVLLGPGAFNLSTAIDFAHKSRVVLRGSGANSTFVAFNSGVTSSCYQGSPICVSSTDGSYPNGHTAINWTAGYSQGATSITLASTTGLVTNSTIIVLNQCDDGKSGSSCTGSSVDNGNYFNCEDAYAISSGCSVNGPDSGNVTTARAQSEMFYATTVNSGTGVVTLNRPLRAPNWSSARTPQAWFIQPIQYVGIEDFSVDMVSDTAPGTGITFYNAANVWVKGVRMVNTPYSAVYGFDVIHMQVESSYFALSTRPIPSDGFAVTFTQSSDCLVQNIIGQRLISDIFDEGASNGNVYAYNFLINDNYPTNNYMAASIRPHAAGDSYQLWEGNAAMSVYNEDYHGTHPMITVFRNFLQGWYSNPSLPKNYETNGFLSDAFNRYTNIVGNVLGTPGFHNAYKQIGGLNTSGPNYVLALGLGNIAVSPATPSDPLVNTTSLFWANYDTVTGAVRFCGNSSNTNWSNICAITSEVPAGISFYSNSIPTKGDTGAGQSAMPASFYLSSRPSWWSSSIPFPAIGPDVSSGNVGQCTGTLNTAGQYAGEAALSSSQCRGTSLSASAWSGHVNAIPAMNCALNIMGMPPDGSGGALSFSASACYGGSSSSQAPNPPTNLVVVVN